MDTKIQLSIAKKIKEIRQENNLNQSDFGKKLYVSQDTISLWETGKTLPNAEQIYSICSLFSVSADYLLCLSD